METAHKFPYKWNLADGYPAKGIEYHGKKVFGTFICGGGSTMGYKLAGFDHFGGVEFDAKVAAVYRKNHDPKYLFVEDIREFNKRTDIPAELYDLDLLDGSPPCSSFSMAGNRDKDWGKKKQFREGQAFQRLDDLVFEYIETIRILQPKVALLENVKGLITGNAKAYAKNMKIAFEAAGYRVQVFLLNAASMGVPQKRERVFFIGLRKDFDFGPLVLGFDEKAILFGEYRSEHGTIRGTKQRAVEIMAAKRTDRNMAKVNKRIRGVVSGFNASIEHDDFVKSCITSSEADWRFFDKMECSDQDYLLSGTFALDYDFSPLEPKYLIGMSVPPVMTAQISHQIYLQWLSKIQKTEA